VADNNTDPVSMRVHNAILAAINATMRSNVDDSEDISDEAFAEATLVALIPLSEVAAKKLGMSPSALVAMLALSLAHEAAPNDAKRAVTSIIATSQFEAMHMMRLAGTANIQ
jgi:hypothetical protein